MDYRAVYQNFLSRERQFEYHGYREDMLQYELLSQGDDRALAEAEKMFLSEKTGTLSQNPLRNAQYMLACAATLACRHAIIGGVDSARAYAVSDLYIQRADQAGSIEKIRALELEMFREYLAEVKRAAGERRTSPLIAQCVQYIRGHLHERMTVERLAQAVDRDPSYLSQRFHRETGLHIGEFIRREKVETAKNMLAFSEYTSAEIANILSFSSQSHFTSVFRRQTGQTPAQYRRARQTPGFGAGEPQKE